MMEKSKYFNVIERFFFKQILAVSDIKRNLSSFQLHFFFLHSEVLSSRITHFQIVYVIKNWYDT